MATTSINDVRLLGHATCLVTALLFAFILVAPLTTSHTGGQSLGVVVPAQDDCPPERDRCLEQFTLNGSEAKIQAGDRIDLMVWNDDDEAHQIYVTLNRSQDPTHTETPTHRALTQSSEVPAGSSRTSEDWTFSIPTDAEALYVWCTEPGHETEGEWMRVALAPGPGAQTPAPGPFGMIIATLTAALGAYRWRRQE